MPGDAPIPEGEPAPGETLADTSTIGRARPTDSHDAALDGKPSFFMPHGVRAPGMRLSRQPGFGAKSAMRARIDRLAVVAAGQPEDQATALVGTVAVVRLSQAVR